MSTEEESKKITYQLLKPHLYNEDVVLNAYRVFVHGWRGSVNSKYGRVVRKQYAFNQYTEK